jgi:hypothetical protein
MAVVDLFAEGVFLEVMCRRKVLGLLPSETFEPALG